MKHITPENRNSAMRSFASLPFNAFLFAAALACSAVSAAELRAPAEESPLILFTAVSGKPGAAEAREIVQGSVRAGFSQWIVYARSGLEWEYMGEEWLAFVGHMLREAKAAGGHIWLYDEYNWPSGSCKGRVPRENPEWTYTEYAVRRNGDGTFAWQVKRNDQLSMYDKYFDVNAYSVEAMRRFIELTHEVYERRFGEYFRDGTIRGIFTDEPAHPSIMKWEDPQPVVTFRWWAELEAQYRGRTGRDFRKDVEESLRDPSKKEVWEIYTEMKGRQFRRAFFDQIEAWCRKMGIQFCGHMIGEGSPYTSCNWNGLPLNSIRGLSLPGMDKIGSQLCNNDEWLTYATAQYGIERNSRPGDQLSCHGGVELYALGPMDYTHSQLAQRFWTCALYGMDHYFTSLYHVTARGFLEKGGYGMIASPTQPWFAHSANLHDEARLAAKWSRKRFVREVAVRYPQRLFGRLALKRAVPGEKPPLLAQLLQSFSWNQVSYELVQEDEKCDLKYVFSFRDGKIVEERSGREFSSTREAREWLYRNTDASWRVVDSSGRVVPGLLVRHYSDGTGVVLNLTESEFTGLRLGRGDVFDLPSCGRAIFGTGERGWKKAKNGKKVVADEWRLSLDHPSLRRIWFSSNNVARIVVKEPVKNARLVVCNYPEGSVKISVNGKYVSAGYPAAMAPYAYAELYRESAPFTLDAGEYELRLEGRGDGSVFLPVLWLSGEFAATEPGVISACPKSVVRLGSLADAGVADFAGEATYSADVSVEGTRLELDTGGLAARVKLGGVDLGERDVVPFEWDIPKEMLGKRVKLEVTLVTSIRPVFGREPVAVNKQGKPVGHGVVKGVQLDQPLWSATILNGEKGGLRSASWISP